jgi:hypothetical protein
VRTTLAIDDDLLAAARDLAVRERRSIGEVISDLARSGLKRGDAMPKRRNGLPVLPVKERHGIVTMELVNRLRDETE